MSEYRDIVIAGGGMVGASLALQLGAILPEHVRILLVEGFPFPKATPDKPADYHPSFDARSTALSYGSRLIYEQIGVWSDLEQWLCPIETIHVSNKGRFGSAVMKAVDYEWPALGYVVENTWLGNTLIQSLYRQGRVELLSPAKVIEAVPGDGHVKLKLDGDHVTQEIEAGLLLVADGANSGLREQLGVAVEEKPYRQHAIVANIAFAQDHRGCAYERFTDDGPVALLPLLPTRAGEHRAGLVWTMSPEQSEYLHDCDKAEFLRVLQARFGYRLGRMTQVGDRHQYPLALIQSAEQVRNNIVVMGNAAHALHPVAGQGYNLALRDVSVLGEVLARAEKAAIPLGNLEVLAQYEQRQKVDQARTVSFSDKLPALFMNPNPLMGLASDMGLSSLDVFPSAKRELVRQAAGMANVGDAGHV